MEWSAQTANAKWTHPMTYRYTVDLWCDGNTSSSHFMLTGWILIKITATSQPYEKISYQLHPRIYTKTEGGGSKYSYKNDENRHRNTPFLLGTGKNFSLNAVGNVFWKRACFCYNLILVWCNIVFRQPREGCMFFS